MTNLSKISKILLSYIQVYIVLNILSTSKIPYFIRVFVDNFDLLKFKPLRNLGSYMHEKDNKNLVTL
jgi:hypothetical protein